MVTEPWSAVLEAERLVEPVTAAEMPALLEIDRSARQAGDTYVRFCRTSMTIAYNTQAVKKEDLPKTWKDLPTRNTRAR